VLFGLGQYQRVDWQVEWHDDIDVFWSPLLRKRWIVRWAERQQDDTCGHPDHILDITFCGDRPVE
jgi:hypothetical protein